MARGDGGGGGGWLKVINGTVDSPSDFDDHEINGQSSTSGSNSSTAQGMASIDGSLRCPICGEIYRAPMILSTCGHTFCSLCIRRALMNGKGECPSCRMGGGSSARRVTDADLRRNAVVAEVVVHWEEVRRGVLSQLKKVKELESTLKQERETNVPTRKRKPQEESPEAEVLPSNRSSGRTRRRVDYNDEKAFYLKSTNGNDVLQTNRPVSPEAADPDDPDAKVICPICQGPIKNSLAFQHTATCNGDPPATSEPTKTSSSDMRRSNSREVPQDDSNVQRLHLPNYTLLKVSAIRDLLRKCNISTDVTSKAYSTGRSEKSVLERRHRRWITLHNANCDELPARRRSFRDLKRELVEWEMREDQDEPAGPSQRDTEDREADKKHQIKHKDQFDDLIRLARQSRDRAVKPSTETPKSSNIETDSIPSLHDDPKPSPGRAEKTPRDKEQQPLHSVIGTTKTKASPQGGGFIPQGFFMN